MDFVGKLMRRPALLIAVLLAATTARAAPLDDWLAALPKDADVVVVPEVRRAVGPLSDAAARLLRHPGIARLTQEARVAAELRWGFEPLDLKGHADRGLDPAGPALLSDGAIVLPTKGPQAAEDYLAAALGVTLEAATVAGRKGWRTDDGVAVFRDGLVFAARDEARLKALLDAPAAPPATREGCPAGRGEADLYVLLRKKPLGGGCVTARFDPDRMVVLGRFDGGGGWLAEGDPGLWALLGIDATGAMAVRLDAGAARDARALFEKHLPGLGRLLDGRLAASAGPALTDLTVALGVTDEAAAEKALSALLRKVPATTAKVRPMIDGGFRLTPTLPAELPPDAPVPQDAWVGTQAGALVATTRVDPGKPKGDPRGTTPGGPDVEALQKAGLGLIARVGGPPHDGLAWFDALRGLVRDELGFDADTLRDLTGAVAYVGAHVAAFTVALTRRGKGLDLRVELVTL